MINKQINKLKEIVLNTQSKIGIVCHVMPDGDSIGSSTALKLAIEKLGKQVQLLNHSEPPKLFHFLKDADAFSSKNDESYDLLISLDCSDADRLGSMKQCFLNAKQTVNIDHHISNEAFADINIVDVTAAATGEIVFQIIENWNIELLDEEIAKSLYTAIVMDTGNFSFSNTTSRTHEVASKLMQFDINVYRLCNQLFRTHSLARTRLLGDILGTLEMHEDNRISVLTVSDEMIQKAGATQEDTEGIIDFGREIDGVEIAIFVKERPDKNVKVSLRSKDYMDVCEIAKQFNGGGHQKAAGCSFEEELNVAKAKIVQACSKAIQEER